MRLRVIALGLILIPFVDVLPFLDHIGGHMRSVRMEVATVFALILGLLSFRKPTQCHNKYVLAFLSLIPLTMFYARRVPVLVGNIIQTSPWVGSAVLTILVFFLMFIAVSNVKVSRNDFVALCNIFSVCGFVASLFCICHYFGFAQFFFLDTHAAAVNQTAGRVIGHLGHATLTAPFIGMCLPISLCRKHYKMAIVMAIGILLTKSQVGIGAAIAGVLAYYSTKGYRQAGVIMIVSFLSLLVLSSGFFGNDKMRNFIGDSGRFQTWKNAVSDIKDGLTEQITPRPLTGYGPGSFRVFYHLKHPIGKVGESRQMLKAHNEYLEILYAMGIFGLIAFLMAMYECLKNVIPVCRYRHLGGVIGAFVSISVAAGGTFVWQLGATGFYSCVLFGLLNNESVLILSSKMA